MTECEEQVYSNDYFDFIVPYRKQAEINGTGVCKQRIDEDYDIFYTPREMATPTEIGNYGYLAMPKCFGLLDQTALEVSGILRLQNQPVLQLNGNGVMVGFLDTGIDYTNKLFRYSSGETRIVGIWDQTIRTGRPPEGIIYGTEYREEQINQALAAENPYDIVPSRDENGHGTFLAGVACGGEDYENDFIGAAPQSKIAVVKLKEAKQYLRDYYILPEDVPAYQENDVMMAVSYLNRLALATDMPLVLCIALGSGLGSRGRGGPLAAYLNYICMRRKRVVVTATGNEANSRHHFQGRIVDNMEYEDVEISVEEDMPGFFMEIWATAPELFAVSVISPTGEQIPRIPVRTGPVQVYDFVFEGTSVMIAYRVEANETAGQLIYFRFDRPKKGLWTIRVFPQSIITGVYNIWLPMRQMTAGNMFFLRPSPDTTLTIPSTAAQVISVGGYNPVNGSIFADSGRGYTIVGDIKPDFAAPAVNVAGPGLLGNYVTYTGTSAAAAITAGACAQVMQWALVDQNNPILSNAGIKNMLIRGTRRFNDRSYPNREWGYGALDLYGAFLNLRI